MGAAVEKASLMLLLEAPVHQLVQYIGAALLNHAGRGRRRVASPGPRKPNATTASSGMLFRTSITRCRVH